MKHLGFESYPTEPDVWLRPAIHSDGDPYYDSILLYTEKCFYVSENRERLLMELDKYFPLKSYLIGPTNIYLGVKF